ncbi:MAG: PQQ-dependent sugar dehydrogenase [Verrucomicrobiales bacterium]
MKLPKLLLASSVASSLSFAAFAADTQPVPSGPQQDGPFRKVIIESDKDLDGDGKLDDYLQDPMEMAVSKDGRVFYALRNGTVRMWSPKSGKSIDIAKVPVFTGLEDGLLGITLDPNFAQNQFVYLFYAPPETKTDDKGQKVGENLVSRFVLKDDKLDLASEKIIIRIATQRQECCHSGGSLNFDSKGNLYASVGDNTNPFASDGFSPIDRQDGRSPWSAEKSSASPNDLRGKILRVHPEADGSVTIPNGNLFPPGTEGTRPEIYVMGNRNPFRIGIDQKTGFLYWGDVGPDAGSANEKRGPAGFDEVNQARQAGFFGWPYFIADNKPYLAYNFETKESGERFDASKPLNESPFNSGKKELPPAQPAFIYYPHAQSSRFPVVNAGGGRTAMAGPVYYFDENLDSPNKLPKEFDHTLFIYEWSRNWIIAVKLDENDKIVKMERFAPKMTFKRPMDMELGPDGCLYLVEYGTNWEKNMDSQIVRIEYAPPQQVAK